MRALCLFLLAGCGPMAMQHSDQLPLEAEACDQLGFLIYEVLVDLVDQDARFEPTFVSDLDRGGIPVQRTDLLSFADHDGVLAMRRPRRSASSSGAVESPEHALPWLQFELELDPTPGLCRVDVKLIQHGDHDDEARIAGFAAKAKAMVRDILDARRPWARGMPLPAAVTLRLDGYRPPTPEDAGALTGHVSPGTGALSPAGRVVEADGALLAHVRLVAQQGSTVELRPIGAGASGLRAHLRERSTRGARLDALRGELWLEAP